MCAVAPHTCCFVSVAVFFCSYVFAVFHSAKRAVFDGVTTRIFTASIYFIFYVFRSLINLFGLIVTLHIYISVLSSDDGVGPHDNKESNMIRNEHNYQP